MATKKHYTRLRATPGYTLKREYHVNKQEYDDYYNLHEAELAEQLRQIGYRVTKPRVKALARANVNAYHHYPRAPSQWNMYVKNNIHRAMDEHNASAGESLCTPLNVYYILLHIQPLVHVYIFYQSNLPERSDLYLYVY